MQPLAVGVLRDQRLERAHHLGVAAERHLRLEQLLERGHADVLEPRALALRERLLGEVGERASAPQSQRPLEQLDGALRVGRDGAVAALGDEPLEAVRVDAVGLHPQLVAVLARQDHVVRAASVFRSRETCT